MGSLEFRFSYALGLLPVSPCGNLSANDQPRQELRHFMTLTFNYDERLFRAVENQPAPIMLVCQCNMITSREIEDIVLDLLKADPWQLVVPAKVYAELNRRAKCSGCVPNVVDIIVRVTENYHAQHAHEPAELVTIQSGLDKLKKQRIGGRLERRSTGHRAA